MSLHEQDALPLAANGPLEHEAYGQLSVEELMAQIRQGFLSHRAQLGLRDDEDADGPDGSDVPSETRPERDRKERIRAFHAAQRAEYRKHERRFIETYGRLLLERHFANGRDIIPNKVEPELVLVPRESEEGRLFRLATLLWSVPVSKGYGRRMRFLVKDRSNGKLMGLFALGDPVFNIKKRDDWIDWTSEDRRQRLVNVMDAYVVGAVPPYNMLLGGKVVASLMTSQEVYEAFIDKYDRTRGIISEQYKHAQLALITVTSALGRSSLYNRLRLPGIMEFVHIGMTEGWGHFHVPEKLFRMMRRLLELNDHPYASGYRYKQGPNWRMRVVREALDEVGLDQDLMKHGVQREIFAVPLAPDWREFLQGKVPRASVNRPPVDDVARAALVRWLLPRAERRPEYREWNREQTWRLMVGDAHARS